MLIILTKSFFSALYTNILHGASNAVMLDLIDFFNGSGNKYVGETKLGAL